MSTKKPDEILHNYLRTEVIGEGANLANVGIATARINMAT